MAKQSRRAPRGIGRRILAIGGVFAVVWFAVQGGEYDTFDVFSQKARRERIELEVADLQRQVDSLAAWKRAIQTDRAVKERIVREEFGMVRGEREMLYRFTPARDSAP